MTRMRTKKALRLKEKPPAGEDKELKDANKNQKLQQLPAAGLATGAAART